LYGPTALAWYKTFPKLCDLLSHHPRTTSCLAQALSTQIARRLAQIAQQRQLMWKSSTLRQRGCITGSRRRFSSYSYVLSNLRRDRPLLELYKSSSGPYTTCCSYLDFLPSPRGIAHSADCSHLQDLLGSLEDSCFLQPTIGRASRPRTISGTHSPVSGTSTGAKYRLNGGIHRSRTRQHDHGSQQITSSRRAGIRYFTQTLPMQLV
jgi:hypothetical protein